MTEHNYTTTLYPWGNKPGAGVVQLSPSTHYGYFELRDGSEGGGLWFDQEAEGLTLQDFDGQASLPLKVVDALRAFGVTIDPIFEL